MALLTLLAASCTYGPEEQTATVGQIVPLGDSYRALVVVQHDRFRRPTGLSTFPDGGKWRFTERRAIEYLVDARAPRVDQLALQMAADSLWESFSAAVAGLDGDSVAFLRLIGCLRGGECHPALQKRVMLRLSMRGDVQVVPDKPASAVLPGVMMARRPGEQNYVRFGSDGGFITARFEDSGPSRRLFRLHDDGLLTVVER